MDERTVSKTSKLLKSLFVYRTIVLILLLALVLRVFFALSSDLWLDEAFSVVQSSEAPSTIMHMNDNTSPLYYLLLHYWMELFGYSELVVRGLSILLGVLLVFFVWKYLGEQPALLIAVFPILVEYSSQTRTYSLFIFAATMHFIFAREKEGQGFWGAFFGVLTVLAHAYGILFVIVNQLVAYQAKSSKSSRSNSGDAFLSTGLKKWLFGQSLALVVFLVWAIHKYLLYESHTVSWIEKLSFWKLMSSLYYLFSGSQETIFGTLFFITFLVILLFYARKKTLIISLLPLIVALLVGFFIPIFHPKYVLPVIPLILLSLDELPRHLLLGLALLAVLSVVVLSQTPRHVPWEELPIESPMYYYPDYAVFPLTYYYLPHCMGYGDHAKCARENGFYYLVALEGTRGAKDLALEIPCQFAYELDDGITVLLMGDAFEGAKVWHANEHWVSMQQIACRIEDFS